MHVYLYRCVCDTLHYRIFDIGVEKDIVKAFNSCIAKCINWQTNGSLLKAFG